MADIIFLQETHGTIGKDTIWRNEWGGDAFFANYNSHARGVAILFKDRNEVKVHDTKKFSDGRALLLNVEYEQAKLCLLNIQEIILLKTELLRKPIR